MANITQNTTERNQTIKQLLEAGYEAKEVTRTTAIILNVDGDEVYRALAFNGQAKRHLVWVNMEIFA